MLKPVWTGEAYRLDHGGFGDLWATVNYALTRPVVPGIYPWQQEHAVGDTLREIASLLETPAALKLVDFEPPTPFPWKESFACPYLPTRARWAGAGSGAVCYQLDGKSERGIKNLTWAEEVGLLTWLSSRYRVINVGGRRPLGEVVRAMAGAEAFVGVPSGMSHVANSVGVPSVVVLQPAMLAQYGGFERFALTVYPNKPDMVFYAGPGALMRDAGFVRRFRDNRRRLVDPELRLV